MGLEAYITLGVMILAMILFITEKVSVDVVSIGIIVALVFSGVITTKQGIQGFANEAVITVMAMFVLSAAVINTHVIERVEPTVTKILKKSYALSVSVLALIVGSMSAFVNNTPVVATFIPVISKSAKDAGFSASRFLIPLSFVAMFGGMCTLIGTSTNLLVSGISSENGLGEFSMFLLTPLGLIFSVVGVAYLILFGRKLIPERAALTDDSDRNKIDNFLSEIRYTTSEKEASTSIGEVFEKVPGRFEILSVKRGDHESKVPGKDFVLLNGDVLLVRGDMEKILRILRNENLRVVERNSEKKYPRETTTLLQLILQSNADIVRKKIKEVAFSKRFNANILAIRQRGKSKFENLDDITLRSGDVLLVQTDENGYEAILEHKKRGGAPFLIFNETHTPKLDKRKLFLALFTILSVILSASLGLCSIATSALAGIVFLAATKAITMEDAYKNIDWQVIFLLAGALSLEKAIHESGLSPLIGEFMINHIGSEYGPHFIISLLYLLTWLLTGIISNNAAAALLAPIAIAISKGMELSAVPFLVAIALAGSASFYTPIGYQTNTMVYSAGNYRFKDFAIIGLPLNIIFWILASFLIPVIYPLQ